MSDRHVTSKREKKPYFCKICQAAFLTSDGLHFHYNGEEHIKMEEAYKGWKSGKRSYSCLEDYILCPTRKEPLIGLQYIIQFHPKVDRKDAFECRLCRLTGPLEFIIYHIEGFKHRDKYLSVAYRHLLPTYRRLYSLNDKKLLAREHAFKVQQEEKTLNADTLKNCTSKIDKKFWKLGIKRQEKLEEHRKKLSPCEAQKEKVLQYMETLVITSQEEADLVQNLTQQLEAAMDVFSWNTKPRYKSYKRERRPENSDKIYSDIYPNKRRSVWYESEYKPSRSPLPSDEKQSISGKHDDTHEDRSRERSRSSSNDMSLKVTFSTGSENEAKPTDVQQELQEPSTSCHVILDSGNLSEATELSWHPSDVCSSYFQSSKAKRTRKQSTDVEKWESLFANHHPEMSGSTFSWGQKSPSLNTEESPSVEKKKITRRASLVALSTFTLFSQEEQEHDPASGQPGSETLSPPQSPGFKGNMSQDKGPQHELKQVGNRDEELPCSSDAADNEAGTTGDKVMHTEPEELDEKCQSIPNKSHWHVKAETSWGPLSDVNAAVAPAPQSSHLLDVSSEYSDLKACGSRHLDTKSDGQDADSSVLSKTLASGKLYESGRQLSPQVLQLFKGKDTNSIVRILETLSPFYPALQDLDLEVFAEGLSKTGAIPE